MGDAAEALGRGRDKVLALRLAQSLQPRDDTALALDDAIAKYGFRITEDLVQADSARPRICVNFKRKSGALGRGLRHLCPVARTAACRGVRWLPPALRGRCGTRQTL